MGHVWNITRWGRLELKYHKLQALQMCRSAFQYNKWEILNIWARSWYYQKKKKKKGRQELKTARALAALKHPRKKPVLQQAQVSPTILTSPTIKERMMRTWESEIALMEFKQVRGSRMNRVQWEKKLLWSELKGGSMSHLRSFQDKFKMGIPWRFQFT